MDFRYVQDEFWKMERWVKELESRLNDHDQTIGDLKNSTSRRIGDLETKYRVTTVPAVQTEHRAAVRNVRMVAGGTSTIISLAVGAGLLCWMHSLFWLLAVVPLLALTYWHMIILNEYRRVRDEAKDKLDAALAFETEQIIREMNNG